MDGKLQQQSFKSGGNKPPREYSHRFGKEFFTKCTVNEKLLNLERYKNRLGFNTTIIY